MTKQEYAGWKALTESSRHHWMEDDIFRLNKRGSFYFIGGEDGVYMRIEKNGHLEIGKYEGAVPHIGEAFFEVVGEKQCGSYSEAFAKAMDIGGKQFLVDMFSGQKEEALRRARLAYDEAGGEKPSVLSQIHDAKSSPTAAKPKTGRGRDGMER